MNYHIQILSRFKVISGISKNRAARHESYPVRQSPPCHNFMVSLTLYLVKRLQLLYSCYFYVCIKKYRYNHFLTCTGSEDSIWVGLIDFWFWKMLQKIATRYGNFKKGQVDKGGNIFLPLSTTDCAVFQCSIYNILVTPKTLSIVNYIFSEFA